jgi:Leucine-rich repeat (LRR) protein
VIDKLPKNNGVFKCPYTKNNLFAFKDILIRFRRQLQGTKLLSKVDDYLKNIYNWDSTLLTIDLEKDEDGRYIVYTLEDVNRNFEQLGKEKELKLAVRYKDTEEYMEDIDMNPILSKIFELNNIIELDASSVYLESLPPGIGNLSSLKKLTLIETSLRELPLEIGQLQSLQILDLQMNELKAIPFEIGQLENLKELYLGENRIITKLPIEIGNLRNLRTFKINYQQLHLDPPLYVDLLPDTIGQLSALTYLDVSEAYITRLPDSIGNLQNIEELNISGNYITRLPESLINIITSSNLRSIDVTYLEQLEDIPTTLKDPFSKLMTKAGVVFKADREFKELLMEDDE